jgi:hypothetical protein
LKISQLKNVTLQQNHSRRQEIAPGSGLNI